MRGARTFTSKAQAAKLLELERAGAVAMGTTARMMARTFDPARLPKTAPPQPARPRLSNRMPPRPSITRMARRRGG